MIARPGLFVVTYCSREKDPAPGLMPAVRRYLSPRIRTAGEAAAQLGTGFLILSGLYGLIEPEREIPYYDHLLTADQVADHAGKIAGQLRDRAASQIVFVSRSLAADPGTGPYRQALSRGCSLAGVGFRSVETDSTDLSAAKMVELIGPVLPQP